MRDNPGRHPASFRDPAGFVFQQDGRLFRQVNRLYKENFNHLLSSGLYDQLVKEGRLVKHEQVDQNFLSDPEWYTTLIPEQIPFVSYPFEWCFDQLKDAALLTLHIMQKALDKGMILKDATPFNILFTAEGRPVFIDTLSFEKYSGHQPWVAYRQFCENFLAPLLLNASLGMETDKLFLSYPDGVPVQQCATWLRFKSRFHSLALLHIHLQKAVTNGRQAPERGSFSKSKLVRIIDHLETGITKLKLTEQRTTWNEYYDPTLSPSPYLKEKEMALKEFLQELSFNSALDLGCNTGRFTKLLHRPGCMVIGTDMDSATINEFYVSQKKEGHFALPLVANWMHPSPSTGWENKETQSLLDRSGFDLGMALALIHHLVIARNIPLTKFAQLMSRVSRKWLIVEFVTKEDERVKEILDRKGDIFPEYDPYHFGQIFSAYFNLKKSMPLKEGRRILYLFERK